MDDPDNEAASAFIVLHVDPADAGRRIDQYLAERLAPDLSRSRIQTLIAQGAVQANGRPVGESRLKLAAGDTLQVHMPEPEPATPLPQAIPLTILHEDDDIIVIDKPAGLVVHPGAGNPSGTLVNALLHHCGNSLSGIGGVRRPGIVHRLDKDTSGVMVVAKTDRAHRALAEAFAAHGADGALERAYLALVWGELPRDRGRVDAPLGRSSRDRLVRAVVSETQPDARHAVTNYAVRERYGKPTLASLVECRLETGRTHQIRVHMAHLGHPLIGDQDYGRGHATKANLLPQPLRGVVTAFGRQALHAYLLAFAHPVSGKLMRFETPLPADMAEMVELFRRL
jgi:23S rRNA pseudouridine1911/1915/1917 synthase